MTQTLHAFVPLGAVELHRRVIPTRDPEMREALAAH
jgi:hypothetical protein